MSFIQPVVPTLLIKLFLLLLKYYRIWYQIKALEKRILEKDKKTFKRSSIVFFLSIFITPSLVWIQSSWGYKFSRNVKNDIYAIVSCFFKNYLIFVKHSGKGF